MVNGPRLPLFSPLLAVSVIVVAGMNEIPARTRIPQRADELASGELGRGFAVDAHVPQRPCVVRLILFADTRLR